MPLVVDHRSKTQGGMLIIGRWSLVQDDFTDDSGARDVSERQDATRTGLLGVFVSCLARHDLSPNGLWATDCSPDSTTAELS